MERQQQSIRMPRPSIVAACDRSVAALGRNGL